LGCRRIRRSPNTGCRRLQPLVDTDDAALIQLDAGLFKSYPRSVRNPSHGDEDVAALDRFFTGRHAQRQADPVTGLAVHTQRLGRHDEPDTFVAEDLPHGVRDVRILATHDLWPGLDDRHLAAEPAVGLRHFEAYITATQHNQMSGPVVQL
jgi:hypothetical protein